MREPASTSDLPPFPNDWRQMWAMNTPGVIWFLVAVFALLLVDRAGGLPGPLEWRPWLVVILTVTAWLALKWSWFRWNPPTAERDRLERAIAAAAAGALSVGAYLALSAPTHEECTYEIQTRDGTECVSDEYVTVEGGDVRLGTVLVGLAAVAFAVSMNAPKGQA